MQRSHSFFGCEILEAYKIVPIIALAYFVSQTGGLMNCLIYQEKKTVAIMMIAILGVLLKIGVNVLGPFFED